MIRHIVFFTLSPGATEQPRAALLDGLANLPNHFAEMKDFQLGANVSKRDTRFSYGMTMRFNTLAQLESYLNSERHERFVAEQFKPFVSERSIVSMLDGVL